MVERSVLARVLPRTSSISGQKGCRQAGRIERLGKGVEGSHKERRQKWLQRPLLCPSLLPTPHFFPTCGFLDLSNGFAGTSLSSPRAGKGLTLEKGDELLTLG